MEIFGNISMKTLRLATSISLLSISNACGAGGGPSGDVIATKLDLGIFAIGETPKGVEQFLSTDCDDYQKLSFSDCSALDATGMRYTFFDGALSKVSAQRDDIADSVVLPAGIEFGEKIESAARKVEHEYKVELDRGMSEGRTVYSSDYAIQSDVGVPYSIEIIADNKGRLAEVVQRTDF